MKLPCPTIKINQLNSVERKQLLLRADDLHKKKTCSHFSYEEIQVLLLFHRSLCESHAKSLLTKGGPSSSKTPTKEEAMKGALSAGKSSDANNKKARTLTRTQFREILHRVFEMTEDLLMDRIFKTFDRTNDSLIDDYEFVEGLAVFLRGTLAEQIDYSFTVYDINSDGNISRDEMFQLLKSCQIKAQNEEDPEEGIKDLVELAVKMMDKDKDSKLSKADFRQAVIDEPLMLEAFGNILPNEDLVESFEAVIFADLRKNNMVMGL